MNWGLLLSSLVIMTRQANAWQYISPDALPSDSLSDSCKSALIVDLDCPSQVSSFFEGEAVPVASLEEACTTACSNSLAKFEASLEAACGKEDVIEYELGSDPVHISIVATDIYYHHTKTCIKDGARWCNVWAFQNSPDNIPSSSGSAKASVTSAFNMCDNCVIKPLQFQAGTSYSDGYNLQAFYANITKSCSKTGFPLKTTVSSTPSATTSPSTPPCTGSMYTVKDGDDCRSISKANGVSTSWMLYDNNLQAFCNHFPTPGQTICIMNKCKTHTVQAGDTCQSIASAAKISLVQLYTWNPILGEKCDRLSLSVGHTICLTPRDDEDYTPIVRTTTTIAPAVTAAPLPSNLANGTNKNCAQFYSVETGNYCNQIILKFSISLQDFLFLNQGVNKECTNLYAKESYCVAPVGPIDKYPGHPDYIASTKSIPNINFKDLPKATFKAPAITGVATQLPKAKSTRKDCHVFADGSDLQVDMDYSFSFSACAEIAEVWSIELNELQNWNPSLKTSSPDCAFDKKHSYCMAAYKKTNSYTGEPQDSFSSVTTTTTTTAPSNGISTPAPIQSGMVKSCNKLHKIKTTTTCQGIADYNKISIADFYKWNPKVKNDCSNLELGAYACAGVIESTLTTMPTATTTTNGISTPTPTQSGMISNCNKFHLVRTTTTCQGIADYNKISITDFYKWNPKVNSACSNLVLGAYACAGIIGSSATTTSTTNNGVSTPTPTQTGMVAGCTKFHFVGAKTTCQGILDYDKITIQQFYKWNPAVKDDCTNLLLNTYACVAGP